MDEQSLFAELVDLPDPGARAARLDAAADGNPKLRERMERLLARHAAAGSFLECPVTSAFEPDASGTIIGPYKLLELIGEGGMGAVYMAEQTEPVRRRVAVKVIKPGMDSKAVIARFEAERQALALMDHPNIARVFDGGTTDAGRPYFVMELVRGLPVTDYCDGAKLPIRERLALFAQVCRAVQHAHTKGVIHRDLKPSNVLITVIDGAPVPKVIDFGVAKATGGTLTERTLFTGFHQLVGTPLYMAPEQAEMSGVDVDTRADVYALGVLLYELLTGTTPFDPEVLRAAGFDEMRRMIREDEPARPSRRVNTLAADRASTVADRRGVDPRRLGRLIQSELDWVVMRALDKDRNRRYETAGAVAADVERYLADAPVEACPPSVRYRFGKFARRNRVSLAIAAALAAAVVGVAGGVGWGLRDAAARRWAAEQAAVTAIDESTEHYRADRPDAAMASAKRAVDVLAGVAGTDVTATAARERVAELGLAERLEDVWLGEWDLDDREAMYRAAFRAIGLDATKFPEAELAERIRRRVIAPELVAGLDNWAGVRRLSNGPADPLAVKLRAVASAADPDPWSRRIRDVALDGSAEQMTALANEVPVEVTPPAAINHLAWALQRAARPAENEALLRRAVRAYPDRIRPIFTLAERLRHSSAEATRMEALGYFRAALALRPRSVAVIHRIGACLTESMNRPAEGAELFRLVIRLQPGHCFARANLANALCRAGKFVEAVAAAQEAVAASPTSTTYHRLGSVLSQSGRHDEARAAYRAAAGLTPKSESDFSAQGNALYELGRWAEAITPFREAARRDPGKAVNLNNVGAALRKAGKLREAEAAIRTAMQTDPNYAQAHFSLGILLSSQGQTDKAIESYREAIRLNPNEPMYRFNLGVCLFRLQRSEESIAAFDAAIHIQPDFAEAHYNRGFALTLARRPDEAVAAYLQAIRHKPDHAMAHCNLAFILVGQGRHAEALGLFRQGHELGTKDPNWSYPSAQWVADLERLVALGPQVESLLDGPENPADPKDGLAVATVAAIRKRHVRAAELYRAAFAAGPALAGDLHSDKRFHATCSAAQAGCGLGDDATGLDAAGRSRWRRQALEWLRIDLAERERRVKAGKVEDRRQAQTLLQRQLTDSDLACVREAEALTKLPEAEREEWARFWADLKSVLVAAQRSD